MAINLLINATALTSRGALTVIKNFISELKIFQDSNNEFNVTILVAVEELLIYKNSRLNIIFNAAPKKGFLQKYNFEKKEIPKIISEHQLNCYLSLSNTFLLNNSISQYVFIHQPHALTKLKFNEINLSIFMKYNILLNLIYRFGLVKKVKGIIVQTNWMKEAIQQKYRYNGNIEVICPMITSDHSRMEPLNNLVFNEGAQEIKLVYPTSGDKYKNIKRLEEAIHQYNREYDKKVVLYLTQPGDSSEYVKYIGQVPFESMYWLYRQMDALIFPSLTETLGLPLQEATENGLDVLAANLPYAKEICGLSATYFDPRSVQDIVEKIKCYAYKEGKQKKKASKVSGGHTYMDFLNFIKKCEAGDTSATANTIAVKATLSG